MSMQEEFAQLNRQLAASQARETALRDALPDPDTLGRVARAAKAAYHGCAPSGDLTMRLLVDADDMLDCMGRIRTALAALRAKGGGK